MYRPPVVGRRLTALEAATRLGVKRETLYAYVSRGLLTRERAADGRSSTFSAEEIEALAARTRQGGRAGGLELIVASGLTLIEDDRLFYRGVDVADIVPAMPFESVAEWLWTSAPMSTGNPPPWPVTQITCPDIPGGRAIDRLRVLVALAGAADDLRYDVEPSGVVAAARRILSAMVDGLPAFGLPDRSPQGRADRPAGSFPLAARLLPRLGPPSLANRMAESELVEVVNAVLVLLADHELAASTLAARVAASVHADPYSVVSTGLGVIAGALHGAASQPVVHLLDEIGSADRVARVVGERLGRRERIPGLGHKVYRHTDPRAEILFDLLRRLPEPGPRWPVVEKLVALVRDRLRLVVNVDFALGAFVWAWELDVAAAESLFAIARTAGWLAHAIEEYGETPVRFRPRAAYTGPRPADLR